MVSVLIFLAALRHCFLTAFVRVLDLGLLFLLLELPRAALAAENLFLREQLALFSERRSSHTEPLMLPSG